MRAGIAATQALCVVLAAGIFGLCAQINAQAVGPSVSFARVEAVRSLTNGIELRDGSLVMQITALRDDVLRVRAGRDGKRFSARQRTGSSASGTSHLTLAICHTPPGNCCAPA